MPPRPSKVLDPSGTPEARYRIVGRIATGGMAEIYLARTGTGSSQREVVLKRLLPELQGDQEFVQMFYDEARIASQLTHPNIVEIFELGELDGSLFIAMELLRGVTLRDLLARSHTKKRPIPIPLAVRVACEALEGLAYAHSFSDDRGRRLNVVHRDVSPQNILVTYDGAVKLVDFGVAKAEGKLHQTRAGLVKGKFAYMSPEQITGGVVDGRSDIFALSEAFYELLLRRHPFYAASDVDILRAILDVDPPHPSTIIPDFPPELSAAFMTGLKKKPGDRFAGALEMQRSLERYLANQGMPSTTLALGRFVRDLFADKIEAERRAREVGDDKALVEALLSGQPEYNRHSGRSSRAAPAQPPTDEDTEEGDIHLRGKPGRGADGQATPDPAERTESQDHLRSEVRRIFDDTEATVITGAAEPGRYPGVMSSEPPRPPSPNVAGPTGTVIEHLPKRPPVDPGEARPVVTPVPPPGPSERSSERLGLTFFIVGLVALIGAIVYAALLLQQPRTPSMSLVIESEPAGAAIILDGLDIGAVTPRTIPNLSADRAHRLELRLPGYRPCIQEIQALPNLGQYVVSWRFEALPAGEEK